ncbi:hypothetical protein LPJ72_006157, partial [Coemansia sp. Benny D160-2]
MSRAVEIVDYTCQQVHVYRRVAYICNIKFEGKSAVLKLPWTPVSRLSEGVVYDILRLNGVEGIPEVYSSGIICADFLGNRLEYIIMKTISDDVRSHINNIWGMDFSSLAVIEKEQDPVTDTMCFMSIHMLAAAAAATRSLWDDIESLFYVVLGCLFSSYKNGFKSDGAPGFEHSSNKKYALAKAGGVSLDSYASVFGVKYAPEELLGVANKLRTILFYRDSRCIVHNLLSNDEDLRDGEDRSEYYKVLLGDEKHDHILDWGESREDRAKQKVEVEKLEAEAKAKAEAKAAAANENNTAAVDPLSVSVSAIIQLIIKLSVLIYEAIKIAQH